MGITINEKLAQKTKKQAKTCSSKIFKSNDNSIKETTDADRYPKLAFMVWLAATTKTYLLVADNYFYYLYTRDVHFSNQSKNAKAEES